MDWFSVAFGLVALACAIGVWFTTKPGGEPRRAVDHYSGLVRKNPEDAEARRELGFAYMRRGMPQEAQRELRIAIDLGLKDARAFHMLGLALMTTGNLSGAAIQFQHAITLSPMFAEAYSSIAAVHEMRKEFGTAKANYQKAILLDNNLGIAHYSLARIYADTGEHDKAIDSLQQAIRCDKTFLEEARSGTDFDAMLAHTGFQSLAFRK